MNFVFLLAAHNNKSIFLYFFRKIKYKFASLILKNIKHPFEEQKEFTNICEFVSVSFNLRSMPNINSFDYFKENDQFIKLKNAYDEKRAKVCDNFKLDSAQHTHLDDIKFLSRTWADMVSRIMNLEKLGFDTTAKDKSDSQIYEDGKAILYHLKNDYKTDDELSLQRIKSFENQIDKIKTEKGYFSEKKKN
jgi:hypothetical protein